MIIAGAGGAAHLPGMLASVTPLPVIGVPVPLKYLDGMDSLLSIVQMPAGVPVATVAVGNARNAGLLAVRILAAADAALRERMAAFQAGSAAGEGEGRPRSATTAAAGFECRGLRASAVLTICGNPWTDHAAIDRMLDAGETWAIVGLGARPWRTAYSCAGAQARGKLIVPIRRAPTALTVPASWSTRRSPRCGSRSTSTTFRRSERGRRVRRAGRGGRREGLWFQWASWTGTRFRRASQAGGRCDGRLPAQPGSTASAAARRFAHSIDPGRAAIDSATQPVGRLYRMWRRDVPLVRPVRGAPGDPRGRPRVCDAKVAPYAADVDEDARYPAGGGEALHAADFHAPHVPEEYGGAGADALATVIVIEEVARACACPR